MEFAPVTEIELGAAFHGDPRIGDMCILGPDHAVPQDFCATPELRATAMAATLRSPAVLADESAVFVYTGFWTINPLALREIPCAPLPGKSTRWTTDRRLLKDHHIVHIGRAHVTTMERTAADLLHQPLDRTLPALILLLKAGLNVDGVRQVLGERFRGRDSWFANRMMAQIAQNATQYPLRR